MSDNERMPGCGDGPVDPFEIAEFYGTHFDIAVTEQTVMKNDRKHRRIIAKRQKDDKSQRWSIGYDGVKENKVAAEIQTSCRVRFIERRT